MHKSHDNRAGLLLIFVGMLFLFGVLGWSWWWLFMFWWLPWLFFKPTWGQRHHYRYHHAHHKSHWFGSWMTCDADDVEWEDVPANKRKNDGKPKRDEREFIRTADGAELEVIDADKDERGFV